MYVCSFFKRFFVFLRAVLLKRFFVFLCAISLIHSSLNNNLLFAFDYSSKLQCRFQVVICFFQFVNYLQKFDNISLSKKWIIENKKNINKNINTHKLYNKNVLKKFFVLNANIFSFKKILLLNKWKYMFVSFSDITKYIKYFVSFTNKKNNLF